MRIGLMGGAAAACIAGAGAASAQETQTYAYDVHGRLTAVTRTTGATTRTTTYTLDNADNRTSRLLGAPTAGAAMAAPEGDDPVDAVVAPSEPEPSAEDADTAPGVAIDPDTVVGGAAATAGDVEPRKAASDPQDRTPGEPDAVAPQAADTPGAPSRGEGR